MVGRPSTRLPTGPASRSRTSADPRRRAAAGAPGITQKNTRLRASSVRWLAAVGRACGTGCPLQVIERASRAGTSPGRGASRVKTCPVSWPGRRWYRRGRRDDGSAEQVNDGEVRRRLAVGHRGALEHGPPLRVVRVQELVEQAGLPYARLPHDRHDLAVAGPGMLKRLLQGSQLRLPPDEAGEPQRRGGLEARAPYWPQPAQRPPPDRPAL